MLNSFLLNVTDDSTGAISPTLLCDQLHLEIGHLSKLINVNRNTLTRNSVSPRVQGALSPIVEIIGLACQISSSPGKAISWFNHEPLEDFNFQTPVELVRDGHGEAVKAYLRMLADGVYG